MCRFSAVENDWLPDAEPVFDVSGGVGNDPLVDSFGGVADEQGTVGGEDV